ncbi:Tn3 family transposase [Escherichia coli]|uniref:Tn3 family transposase n=1 Tax=Escherichia coli TaxID=562 RepID=UPI003A976FC1
MTGQRIGYIRVSTFDQNPERQLEGVKVDRAFSDKASGKDVKRPQLEALISFARTGDTVVVHSMDRLARNLDDLRRIVQTLTQRGVHAGLNKGEARNALARAVFFNRLGEIRDRSFEQQRYRASGLNLVTAAIVLWNTVYLERAAHALRGNGHAVDDSLLQYLSPLGWEHINLTGDYLWRSSAKIGAGKFRPLRPLQPA